MANKFHLQAILSAVDRITPTLKGVRRGLNQTHKSFRDLGGASRSLLGSIGLPASIGFGAITAGAMAATRATLNYVGAIQDAADRTGMALRPLQELQNVFEDGGVASEEFYDSVGKLNKGLAEAAAGKDKGLASLMTQLRIPLRNAKGEIRSVEEVLPQLADAFEKNENPAIRARIATELFGKSGVKMIPVLMKGSASLAEARREAQRLGTVLSENAVAGLDEVGDGFGLVSRQVRTQFAESFAAAAPAILSATRAIQEWIANNKEMLQLKIGGFIRRIAESIRAWVESGGIDRLIAGIGKAVDGINGFIDAMGGMRNVMIGIGALILVGPVAALFQLGAVLLRMGTYVMPLVSKAFAGLNVLIRANPIIAAATGIAAAAYLIYSNWDGIVAYFADMGKRIKAVFDVGFFDGIIQVWLESWQMLGNAILGIIKSIPLVGDLDIIKNLPKVEIATKRASALTAGAGQLPGSTPLAAAGALNASTTKLNGEVRIRLENAPPGTRVDAGKSSQPGVAFNPDVGYRMAH